MILKRVFDVLFAASALLVFAPLLVCVAVLVKLTSRGPVLYRATRIGRDGLPFEMLKFRTMRVAEGAKITRASDPRITPLGRFLRKTKLDELPQLVNVVRGEMSLVGPRPEDPAYVALYDARQRGVLTVRPGVTSLASATYRDEEQQLSGPDWHDQYIREIMPRKLELDLHYVATRSFIGDLRLIAHTIVQILRR